MEERITNAWNWAGLRLISFSLAFAGVRVGANVFAYRLDPRLLKIHRGIITASAFFCVSNFTLNFPHRLKRWIDEHEKEANKDGT